MKIKTLSIIVSIESLISKDSSVPQATNALCTIPVNHHSELVCSEPPSTDNEDNTLGKNHKADIHPYLLSAISKAIDIC